MRDLVTNSLSQLAALRRSDLVVKLVKMKHLLLHNSDIRHALSARGSVPHYSIRGAVAVPPPFTAPSVRDMATVPRTYPRYTPLK
jgi:hypothetical protein